MFVMLMNSGTSVAVQANLRRTHILTESTVVCVCLESAKTFIIKENYSQVAVMQTNNDNDSDSGNFDVSRSAAGSGQRS